MTLRPTEEEILEGGNKFRVARNEYLELRARAMDSAKLDGIEKNRQENWVDMISDEVNEGFPIGDDK